MPVSRVFMVNEDVLLLEARRSFKTRAFAFSSGRYWSSWDVSLMALKSTTVGEGLRELGGQTSVLYWCGHDKGSLTHNR